MPLEGEGGVCVIWGRPVMYAGNWEQVWSVLLFLYILRRADLQPLLEKGMAGGAEVIDNPFG